MRRRTLALPLLAGATLLSAATWLATSDSGLHRAVDLARYASGGRLQIEQASGRLTGPLHIARLRWQGADRQVEASGIRLDWSPAALLRGELRIAELAVDTLAITQAPSPAPAVLPADLQLPLSLAVSRLRLGQLHLNGQPLASAIAARLSSDGRQHRISDLQLQAGDVALNGQADLDGQAPFPLRATFDLQGRLDQRPLALAATAQGQLDRIGLAVVARQGLAGQASATLTPFAAAPFASARLQLDRLDPAGWLAGAPQAELTLVADIVPLDDGIAGSFGLTNPVPGPLDRQRLPLNTLAGTLIWQGDTLHLATLHAALPGGGELAGEGRFHAGRLDLDLQTSRLDARQLVSALPPSRLSGPLAVTMADARQSLRLDLRDATFKLEAEAERVGPTLRLPRLRLAAGDARLEARGELDLGPHRSFSAAGELQQFDPSRFGRLPAGRLNAQLTASGRLAPQALLDAAFTLRDSQLAGQALHGRGQLNIAWPRIPRADIELAAGGNRLAVQGAYGQPGDRIRFTLDAPHLAALGLEGGLQGQGELSGAAQQPQLSASLRAERLGWPGRGRLSDVTLTAELGRAARAPLRLDLAIGRLDLPDQPGLLRAIRLQGEGSNQAHRLSLRADLAHREQLALRLDGAWNASTAIWSGQLGEARLSSPEAARNVRLLAPAPLTLAATHWQAGPLRLAGDPLDWQATLQAAADAQRLDASLRAQGSRIGQVDASLRATLAGAWSPARDAPWQGRLRASIGDLGWLAELLGEEWQSAGRLNGELQLAGTPNRPLRSGYLRGEQLALRLPAQGLNLTQGELDIDLRDNRLHINRFAFDSLLQPLPRPLRLAARDDLASLDKTPGRLEIGGELRLGGQTGAESGWLDVRLDRLGAFQLPDQWIALSGNGRLSWQDGTLGAQARLAVDAGYWQLARAGTPRLSDDVVVRRPGSAPPAASLRPKVDLDIATELGRHFLFNGAGLSSGLSGEIRITAQGRDLPRASGTIRTRDGRFEAYGQQLAIARGVLRFNGLLDNPGLDVRAVRKGLAVEPGVQIGGTAQKPTVKLVSDPELPDAEKLAWLVLGHGPEQMGAGDATTLLSAASGLLGNDSGNVVQQIKKTFGFDELTVRQGRLGDSGGRQQVSRVAGGSIDTTGSTGQQIFSVGKRLTSNALLSYEQTLGRTEGIVKLTVNLTRQIALIGRAGSDNALDVFYTLTFGRPKAPAAE